LVAPATACVTVPLGIWWHSAAAAFGGLCEGGFQWLCPGGCAWRGWCCLRVGWKGRSLQGPARPVLFCLLKEGRVAADQVFTSVHGAGRLSTASLLVVKAPLQLKGVSRVRCLLKFQEST